MKKQQQSASRASQEVTSKVFLKQEVEVFKRVFDKLTKGGSTISLQSYVDHMKEMSKNKEDGIISLIIRDLEADGDLTVDFKEFMAILEEKVGDLESQEGLKRIFTFLTKDPIKKRASMEDLQKIKTELGLSVSDKDLQRLINFITVTYKERSDFTFDEFERYALKQ